MIVDEDKWRSQVRRDAAMRDSRRLNWTKFSDRMPPEDVPVYVAAKSAVPGMSGEWVVVRVERNVRLYYQSHVAWWAPDLLGLPFDG